MPTQMEKKFSPRAVVKNKVQFFAVLKGKVELHDKGVVGYGQDPPLGLGSLDLMSLDEVTLSKHLHCEKAPNLEAELFSHQNHLPEAALAQNPQKRKMLHGGLRRLRTVEIGSVPSNSFPGF